jgi:glycosyltransferase involved in cell wall biosynthesis
MTMRLSTPQDSCPPPGERCPDQGEPDGREVCGRASQASRDWDQPLRVAFIAGNLTPRFPPGGAEKQLMYMVRALRDAGVDVRVFSLTQGGYCEDVLRSLGLPPYWIGRFKNPLLRLMTLVKALRGFRPHIIQSTHFFANLYAALAARLGSALSIGCSRSDVFYELGNAKGWGSLCLKAPTALLANSEAARRNAISLGLKPERIHVIANVIDLADFDAHCQPLAGTGAGLHPFAGEHPLAIAIGSLAPVKRFDRFLDALALARRTVPGLKALLAGDGPERAALERQAAALGLWPDHLAFLGRRQDVPCLLRQADVLVLTSDHEGFPNVVLEAMAAGRPVVTTPAGDAGTLVQDGVTGYVVPSQDTEGLAARLVELCNAPDLRDQFGRAARRRAEQDYDSRGLAGRLLGIYDQILRRQNQTGLLRRLQRLAPASPSAEETCLRPSPRPLFQNYQGLDSMARSPVPQDRDCLRVGVVLDASVVPNWVAKLLRDLRTSEFAHLTVVLITRAPGKPFRPHLPWGAFPRGLFRVYEAVDAHLFNVGSNALKLVNVEEDIAAASVNRVGPVQEQEDGSLAEVDVRRIEAAHLDVLLDLSSGSRSAIPVGCARYGIWSVHQGDSRNSPTDPALFRELLEGDPCSAAEICVRAATSGGSSVVSRSFARIELLSLQRTRNPVFWKSTETLLRCLRNLHTGGWDPARPLSPCPAGAGQPGTDGTTLGTLSTVRFLADRLAHFLQRSARRLFVQEQWLLAIRRRASACPARNRANGFRLILPPWGHCYADPFLFKKGETNYLFFEEYRFDKPKGVISCLEIDPSGDPAAPRVVLERDYHLSYPFVFEWQGQTYLLPETVANRTVELYRAVEFPNHWVLDRVLLQDVTLTDATLLQQGGRFWLFATPRVQGHLVNDELYLYFADSPLGPWKPHPRNPVVADVRKARPAGRLLRVNGQLFRPAQDCSVRYGYAVTFQKVEVLTETDYQESFAGRIGPGWLPGNLGTHTFDSNEDFEVVDGRLDAPRYAWLPGWWWRRPPSASEVSSTTPYGAAVTTPLDMMSENVSVFSAQCSSDKAVLRQGTPTATR